MDDTKASKPQLSFKTRLLITANTLAIDVCRRSNYTINRRLLSFFDPKVPSPVTTTLPNGVSVSSSDVTLNSSTDLWFRLFIPTTTDPQNLPLIFFIHGGGFAFFTPSTKPYDDFCRRLAGELSAVVVSINYRLSPEHRYPCQYDDVYEVLKFIDTQNHAVLPSNTDLSRCFIAGDSAGGNIGHHVTLKACQNVQDLTALKILGLVLIQPYFGGEERTKSELKLTKVPLVNVERTDWTWKAFLPEGADRNHEAANVFGSASDSVSEDVWRNRFPETIVFTGGFDPLQDWQRRYYQGLKDRKCCNGKGEEQVKLIEYPNAIHAFYGFPQIPEAALLIRDLKDFVQKL
ncbi:hypothetical protein LguiB_024526 [Lonicera macranthoides]